MNSRSGYPPPWMGGDGGGSMHPNANTSFQQRNQQQYMQRSSVPHQQQFQNQQTHQWMRRNQLSSDSAIDDVEKTVQSENGRVILVNSVLDALPTYVMSLFPIPSKVLKRSDSLRRKFIWQGNKENKVIHLVTWDCLITGKKDGVLGTRDLKVHNLSLLMKWLWRYNLETKVSLEPLFESVPTSCVVVDIMNCYLLLYPRRSMLVSLDLEKSLFTDGQSTALSILKARCIANLFSWSNLYPAVNAEQLQDFINSLVLLGWFIVARDFFKLKCHIFSQDWKARLKIPPLDARYRTELSRDFVGAELAVCGGAHLLIMLATLQHCHGFGGWVYAQLPSAFLEELKVSLRKLTQELANAIFSDLSQQCFVMEKTTK
ncbi:hypothetical protein MTR67_024256 [Solanum verrucosum]|uniref:Uncharacterized protein n=1 Tax=Solanum verrucosum TaxID=315347 RepID=A0AAF0QWN7_SOLVR|nr:hypothetical protein MTR67_024256 [Solanum verrucosum]